MKTAHSLVNYEHPAKGKNHCDICEHFIPPSSCQTVASPIRPADWCERFKEKQRG